MKQSVRIILWVCCAALILAAPVLVSSPRMLDEVADRLQEETEDLGREEETEEIGSESMLLRFLVPSACAEKEVVEEELLEDEETEKKSGAAYALPWDFTVPPEANPAGFAADSYEDESIQVRMEHREENGVTWHIAWVTVQSPTQLRTAVANPEKPKGKKTYHVQDIAKRNHAVVAINSDYMSNDPEKTTYEIRQTTEIRAKSNRYKDVLIINEEGDFHFILANPEMTSKKYAEWMKEELASYTAEHRIINAFTFGPALVVNGEKQQTSEEYGYNTNRPEPRTAIGQMGPLSYVMVIAEGRGESAGVTHQQLADFMAGLGCQQAFNLDGGNSTELVFGETLYKGAPNAAQRSQSDIIYFATAVPEENWK